MKISNLQEKYCTSLISINFPSTVESKCIKILICNLLETQSKHSSYCIDFKIYFKYDKKYSNVISVRLWCPNKSLLNQHLPSFWVTKLLRNSSNSKNTGIQRKEIHNNRSHTFSCATAQQEEFDMFMKIGWHIWKPATCWLQQERGGGGGTPGLMSNRPENVLEKVRTPNSWRRHGSKKHLTFKRTATFSACMRTTLKQSHCGVRCSACINVSSKHACKSHRLAGSAC